MNRSSAKFLGLFFATLLLAIVIETLSPLRSHLLTFFTLPLKRSNYLSIMPRQWFFTQEMLEIENAELKSKLLKVTVERAEYKRLQEILRVMPEKENVVLGYVVAERFDGFSNVFIVDKGKLSGVREGSLVESEGALVGYTKELGEDIATIEAIWSPSFEISGVFEKSGIPVLLQGRGSGFLVGKVPKDILIQKGDIVIKDAAKRFVIGEVVSEGREATSPLQEIVVRSPVEAVTLERVFIHIE